MQQLLSEASRHDNLKYPGCCVATVPTSAPITFMPLNSKWMLCKTKEGIGQACLGAAGGQGAPDQARLGREAPEVVAVLVHRHHARHVCTQPALQRHLNPKITNAESQQ